MAARLTKPETFWTDDRCDRLRELWADNTPAPVIAAEFGCTKNAILGKAHRLGLSKVDATERSFRGADTRAQRRNALELPTLRREPRKPGTHQKQVFGTPAIEATEMPPPSIDDASRPRDSLKTLLELGSGECKWPIDNPDGGFLFCANSITIDGCPYCAAHHRRSINPHAYRNALRAVR